MGAVPGAGGMAPLMAGGGMGMPQFGPASTGAVGGGMPQGINPQVLMALRQRGLM